MGEHKYNQTAIAAKEGKLPPKKKKKDKREVDRVLYAKCQEIIYKPLIEAYEQLQIKEETK